MKQIITFNSYSAEYDTEGRIVKFYNNNEYLFEKERYTKNTDNFIIVFFVYPLANTTHIVFLDKKNNGALAIYDMDGTQRTIEYNTCGVYYNKCTLYNNIYLLSECTGWNGHNCTLVHQLDRFYDTQYYRAILSYADIFNENEGTFDDGKTVGEYYDKKEEQINTETMNSINEEKITNTLIAKLIPSFKLSDSKLFENTKDISGSYIHRKLLIAKDNMKSYEIINFIYNKSKFLESTIKLTLKFDAYVLIIYVLLSKYDNYYICDKYSNISIKISKNYNNEYMNID